MTPEERRDLRIAVLEEAIEVVVASANGYGSLAASSARTAVKKLREIQADAVKSAEPA